MNNVWKIILFVVIGIVGMVVSVVVIFALPWVVLAIGLSTLPNPPKPEITSGRFPFHLEYEQNGQRYIVQDTVICTFDGYNANEGSGKYRVYKSTLESGNKHVTLVDISEESAIIFDTGDPAYYLGDPKYEGVDLNQISPNIIVLNKRREDLSVPTTIAKLQESHNIHIIGYHYSEPIQNTFK